MDNQSTSGSDELEFEVTSSPEESENHETSISDDVVGLVYPEMKSEMCLRANSCCLATSFLLQGMFISASVVILRERNKLVALSMAPLILSSLLIALRFFLTLSFSFGANL
ncbi:MAG: hypothetical protein MHMPM18_003597 [Marteilia pararefringens]